jgi:hypothetical protein
MALSSMPRSDKRDEIIQNLMSVFHCHTIESGKVNELVKNYQQSAFRHFDPKTKERFFEELSETILDKQGHISETNFAHLFELHCLLYTSRVPLSDAFQKTMRAPIQRVLNSSKR